MSIATTHMLPTKANHEIQCRGRLTQQHRSRRNEALHRSFFALIISCGEFDEISILPYDHTITDVYTRSQTKNRQTINPALNGESLLIERTVDSIARSLDGSAIRTEDDAHVYVYLSLAFEGKKELVESNRSEMENTTPPSRSKYYYANTTHNMHETMFHDIYDITLFLWWIRSSGGPNDLT